MLELLMAFKICLGLVLLTGLITGYLYTLFSTKEEFQPKINELTDNIIHSNEQTEVLETEYKKIYENIQKKQQSVEKLNAQIHEKEHNINILKKSLDALRETTQQSEREYSSVASILKMQTQRYDQIKDEIGFDTVSSLTQKIDEQKNKLQKIETKIEKETILLNDTQARHERILEQKETLQTQHDKLQNKLQELTHEFNTQKEKLATFEDELKQHIATLTEEAKNWVAKIKIYKEKLLQLKSNQ
jgi:chromosome segregation ATPase